jgi:hypothetical protein
VRITLGRRLAAACVVLGLTGVTAATAAVPASAAQAPAAASASVSSDADGNALTRALEVRFADAHWSWTAWNDSTPVAFGSAQPDYQCAEFVARSLAAAGLIPGLGPDAPQNDYFDYTAPNGKTYDLLLITPLPQYNTIYDYLMDSGLAKDVGDDPAAAQPGDIVVTYLGYDGEASHMGLIATAQTATSEPTVDAHNNARYRYGYHYYEPVHLVKLVPDAFLEVWSWAATQWLQHGVTPLAPGTTSAPNPRDATLAPFSDPSGPQV